MIMEKATRYQRLAESRSWRAGFFCGIQGIQFAEATLAGIQPAEATLFDPLWIGQGHACARTLAAVLMRHDSLRPYFEHQFGQDHLPLVAAEQVVIVLVPILAPPVQDGRDLAAQEGGAFGWGEGAGEAGKGLALGVLDPPAFAVADQMDGVARARGRAAVSGVTRRDRTASPGCTKACGPSVSTVNVDRARVMAT